MLQVASMIAIGPLGMRDDTAIHTGTKDERRTLELGIAFCYTRPPQTRPNRDVTSGVIPAQLFQRSGIHLKRA
jgi:hypothetical protein